jgi:hypothetical protein
MARSPDLYETLDAIRLGTRDSLPRLSANDLITAIRGGVADAFWRILTNGTGTPCADFYTAIREGMQDAITQAALRTGEQQSEPTKQEAATRDKGAQT